MNIPRQLKTVPVALVTFLATIVLAAGWVYVFHMRSPQIVEPRHAWERIFFKSINETTKLWGIEELRKVRLTANDLEVRIWRFGTPLEGFLLRRVDGVWSATLIKTNVDYPPAKAEMITLSPPKSGWNVLWQSLVERGILELPDASAIGCEFGGTDGMSHVVELNQNNEYRTYRYSEGKCSEAQRIKDIAEIIGLEFETVGEECRTTDWFACAKILHEKRSRSARFGKRSCTATNPESGHGVFWADKVGIACVEWTSADLFIKENGQPTAKSFWREAVERDHKKWLSGNGNMRCGYHRDLVVLSIVGSFVTLYDQTSIVCGKGSHFTNMLTVDVTKTDTFPKLDDVKSEAYKIKLTSFFSDRALFKAIAENPSIKRTLETRTAKDRPQDLNGLLKLLERPTDLLPRDYVLNSELTEYAFVEIIGGEVVVRLYLMPTSGYNAATLSAFDIRLPLTSELEADLRKAASGENGFLLNGRGLDDPRRSSFSASP